MPAGPVVSRAGQVLRLLRWLAEQAFLILSGLVATMTVLGHAADWFGGTGLTESLLPFSGTVLLLALAGSFLLWVWVRLRAWLKTRGPNWPLAFAMVFFAGALAFALQPAFQEALGNLRVLVGGVEEAGRSGIAHQVYAAYRRGDTGQMQVILERSRPYQAIIRGAARDNGVDEDVLTGIGAAESSFLPRDSRDGGQGLFQITSPPREAVASVKRQLDITGKPDPHNPTHNAYLAAATLRHYLDEMNGDLFLGLLAYNIGPRNGGLLSIMRQYGARDFYTIQPYLKDLPRDYPVRVLTAALACRLWRTEGVLLRYEEGANARRIQAIGIPGFG